MPGWILPAAAGLASGLANLFSGSSKNKALEEVRSIMEENLIDANELKKILDLNKQALNSSLVNTLNTTAIRSRGVANKGVIGGAIAGQMQAQSIATEAAIRENAANQNRQTRLGIAQLGLQETDPIGDFVSGAIPGLTAGLEFSKYLDHPGAITTVAETLSAGETAPNIAEAAAGYDMGVNRFDGLVDEPIQNPFVPKPVNPYIDYLGQDQKNKPKYGIDENRITIGSFFNF